MDQYSKGLLGLGDFSPMNNFGRLERMMEAEERARKREALLDEERARRLSPAPVIYPRQSGITEEGFTIFALFSLFVACVYYPMYQHGLFTTLTDFMQGCAIRLFSTDSLFLGICALEFYALIFAAVGISMGITSLYFRFVKKPFRIALLIAIPCAFLSAAAFMAS